MLDRAFDVRDILVVLERLWYSLTLSLTISTEGESAYPRPNLFAGRAENDRFGFAGMMSNGEGPAACVSSSSGTAVVAR